MSSHPVPYHLDTCPQLADARIGQPDPNRAAPRGHACPPGWNYPATAARLA
ncbi:hypothetical protein [Telluria aromaticivorans]|uniref:Uncharacterized protein n=1 Tax=Telluria aromaticivorans TaxID=2725995 RepID=A0A7Y2K0A1_9BURK|nr:hypothetical protein [Telluria aromaticivorans]NNG23688.1 hypothetical protein [Telluria aromaticivorans]